MHKIGVGSFRKLQKLLDLIGETAKLVGCYALAQELPRGNLQCGCDPFQKIESRCLLSVLKLADIALAAAGDLRKLGLIPVLFVTVTLDIRPDLLAQRTLSASC